MGVTIRRPAESEFNPVYAKYVSLVPEGDVLKLLEQQGQEAQKVLRAIGEEKSKFRYAADKWSIREVVGHVADGERVFSYRALRFARADTTPLPGFEENDWARASNAHSRTLASLLDDLQSVRAATVSLFRGFSEAEWGRSGTASNSYVTVRALPFLIAGHELHHLKLLKERYLST